jgi:hypothetical protein
MRYKNLTSIPLTWTKIGTVPLPSTNGFISTNYGISVIVNGFFGVLFPVFQAPIGSIQNSQGCVLYLFDGLGNMCTYQTSDFNPSGVNGVCNSQNINQSNNTFIYSLSNGGTWKFIVPNVFLPGQTYVVPATPFNVNSPCNSGDYHGTLFCADQGYVCHEFIQAFPLSDNYWASIYDTQNNFIGGGYLGNSSDDLFNRLNTVIPFDGNLWNRNSLNVAHNFGVTGGDQQAFSLVTPFLNGDPTKLICGGQGNLDVFVSGKNQVTVFPARDFGCPYIGTTQRTGLGITDLFNQFVYPDINVMRLLSPDWFVDLPAQYGSYGNAAYLSKQKKLYSIPIDDSNPTWGDVYVANLDLNQFGIGPLPIFTYGDFPGLANYHRAISPHGLFQA